MTDALHSYGKIYALGKREVFDIFSAPVIAEEKVDGSQISFGMIAGVLHIRSRNRAILPGGDIDKGWANAVDAIRDVAHCLRDGDVWRGEYLRNPRHNVLRYNRIPRNHIAVFDIETPGGFLGPGEKLAEAERVGFECVPCVFDGRVQNSGQISELMERTSYLGGPQIEGLVFKRYAPSVLMAKHVGEAFREVRGAPRVRLDINKHDVCADLGARFATEARWQKAVQHLRDSGELKGGPEDISALMREASKDIHDECADEIRDDLFKWGWKRIAKAATRGLPAWYKSQLASHHFDGGEP